MIINSSDDSGQTDETPQQPSQEVSRLSVDGIASGAPADETLLESPQPTQESQTSPLASASETPPVSPLEPGPAQPSESSLSPTPEPVDSVSPQSEADETGPQADPVKEALEGTPGALGSLEENVARQSQTFQEQGKNIGEVAAADQAAGEPPIPTPEQAPEVSADEVSAVTPDTNSPVSPQPVGDTLPPAAPPLSSPENTPQTQPPEDSQVNPVNPENEDATALVNEFLIKDFSNLVKVEAGKVDRVSFQIASILINLQEVVRKMRKLGISDEKLLSIINNMEALESNNRGMA